mmetsp:Transcript_10544/g.24985  ORF Transcript_10544/g.24985 Transcript_10544/m.24985 type:complete len:102 (+) Transcript_10544:1582-1887(+)
MRVSTQFNHTHTDYYHHNHYTISIIWNAAHGTQSTRSNEGRKECGSIRSASETNKHYLESTQTCEQQPKRKLNKDIRPSLVHFAYSNRVLGHKYHKDKRVA